MQGDLYVFFMDGDISVNEVKVDLKSNRQVKQAYDVIV